MSFSSFYFFLFFPAFFLAYFFVPVKFQKHILLAGNIFFFISFGIKAVVVMLFVITTTHILAFYSTKKACAGGVIILITILFLAKYFFPIVNALFYQSAKRSYGQEFNNWIPIGLSYVTFQAISYLVDLNKIKAFNIYELANFLLFFPKLMSGPVMQAEYFSSIKGEKCFSYEKASEGSWLILIGFLKKLILSDRISLLIQYSFDHTATTNPGLLIITFFLAPLQLYLDFSGYTDIARGFGLILGYELPINFNFPFCSTTVSDFWRRWHISLSNWFNVYVFTPLAINLREWNKKGVAISVSITFTLLGIWHGPKLGFLFFGMIHSLFIAIEMTSLKTRKRISRKYPLDHFWSWTGCLYVNIVFAFSQLFFRLKGTKDVLGFLLHMGDARLLSMKSTVYQLIHIPGFRTVDIAILAVGTVFMLIYHFIFKIDDFYQWIHKKSRAVTFSSMLAMVLLLLFFGLFRDSAEFIYRQF
jgi:alginate O-acetyltransferase complex protein AlgI